MSWNGTPYPNSDFGFVYDILRSTECQAMSWPSFEGEPLLFLLERFDAAGRLLQEPEREEAAEVVEILPLQQAGVADTTNYFALRTSSSATASCSLPVHGGP